MLSKNKQTVVSRCFYCLSLPHSLRMIWCQVIIVLVLCICFLVANCLALRRQQRYIGQRYTPLVEAAIERAHEATRCNDATMALRMLREARIELRTLADSCGGWNELDAQVSGLDSRAIDDRIHEQQNIVLQHLQDRE